MMTPRRQALLVILFVPWLCMRFAVMLVRNDNRAYQQHDDLNSIKTTAPSEKIQQKVEMPIVPSSKGEEVWQHAPSNQIFGVVAHWKEDLRWLPTQNQFNYTVCGHDPANTVYGNPQNLGINVRQMNHRVNSLNLPVDTDCTVPINLGREPSSYLLFILRHWDSLPEWTAFLQADRKAWHEHKPKLTTLQCLQDRLKTRPETMLPFYGLNYLRVSTRQREGTWDRKCFSPLWDALIRPFLPDHPPCPQELIIDGSGQFLVHRDRIRARPKAMYETLYRYSMGTQSWPGSDLWADKANVSYAPGDSAGPSYFLEWTWMVIFGEPALYQEPPWPCWDNKDYRRRQKKQQLLLLIIAAAAATQFNRWRQRT